MSWYFDQAIKSNAILLDGANLDNKSFPLFTVFKNELISLANGEGLELGYTYPGGQNNLRELIAKQESNLEETPIKMEDIVVNSGGCSGTFDNLFRILSKYHNSGRNKVVVPIPSYPEIFKSLDYNKLSTTYLPTLRKNGFQPTAEELMDHMDSQTVAIFLTNPGNPSCTYIDNAQMEKITQIAKRYGCYLIVDAIFEESPGANKGQKTFHSCKYYDKLIKIKGFSKDRPQLNDLRLGWSVSKNEELNKHLMNSAEVSDYSNSTILERIAIKDMINRTSNTNVNYNNELFNYQKNIKAGLIKGVSLLKNHYCIQDVIEPKAGNIIFARVKDNQLISDSHNLFLYFLNKCNTLVSPGNIFKAPQDELWFRITMSQSPQNFEKNIKKILKSLEDIQ